MRLWREARAQAVINQKGIRQNGPRKSVKERARCLWQLFRRANLPEPSVPLLDHLNLVANVALITKQLSIRLVPFGACKVSWQGHHCADRAILVFSIIDPFLTCLPFYRLCRYFAIVHPLKSRMQQSKRRTCRILVAVWVLSCIASLPNFLSKPRALSMELTSPYGSMHRRTCIPNFPADFRFAYFTILFIAFYLIPLLLIAFTSFCIARSLLRTSVLRRQGSLLRQEVNRRKVSLAFGKLITSKVSFLPRNGRWAK